MIKNKLTKVEDYKIVKLNDICNIETGKWDANHAVENGKYAFFTCAKEMFHSDSKRFSGECLIFPGNGVNVGDVYYYNGDLDAYQRTYVLSNIKIVPKYLYYYMLSNWRILNLDKQFGSTTNYIKIGNFTNYTVKVPSKEMQLAIVDELDNLVKELNKAKYIVQTNLENIQELSESFLHKIFSNPIYNCKEKTLGELGMFKNGLNYTQSSKGIPINIIGVGDFKDKKYIECPKESSQVVIENTPSDSFKLKNNDILFVRSNGSKDLVGRSLIVHLEDKIDTYYGGFCIRFRLQDKNILPEYLINILSMKSFRKNMLKGRNGCNITNLTQPILKEQKVFIPSLDKQKEITKIIDSFFIKYNLLEKKYTRKLNILEELQESILSSIFDNNSKNDNL